MEEVVDGEGEESEYIKEGVCDGGGCVVIVFEAEVE